MYYALIAAEVDMGVNLDLIKEQVARVVSYSQDIREPKVDQLLNSWYLAKSDFYELFGNKLIYEIGPIKVELTTLEKQDRFNDFIEKIENKYNYVGLVSFLKANEDNFFDNIVQEPFNDENLEIYVPAGIKISKAFKFFIEDKEELDEVQTMMSMILQESKISGTLCLSIHPLDYLSSSENTYNWRSCHALDGDYRAGNLSYMLDSSTIVCYLRGEENVKLPRFPHTVPWNSKKWRMLLFVSNDHDALFAGRQYPFSSRMLMNTIKGAFTSILRKNVGPDHDWNYNPWYSWSNWHDDYIKNIQFKDSDTDNFELVNKYFPLNGRLYRDKDLIQDMGSLHFNDLLYSSYYTPYYCWANKYSSRHKIQFNIGAEVPCLCCEKNSITSHDMMVCDDCSTQDDYISCEYCGLEMPAEEMIWLSDREMYVCPSCYEEIMEEEDGN